jgi:hypothetical protein
MPVLTILLIPRKPIIVPVAPPETARCHGAHWQNCIDHGPTIMKTTNRSCRQIYAAGGLVTLFLAAVAVVTIASRASEASVFRLWGCGQGCDSHPPCSPGLSGEAGGTWYWLRSPDEEKQVIVSLYNRYCIRCHGVDGRGVWDMPHVPNFADACWQASRSDGQLARIIIEGRGACMPPFRGTLTVEESWAMARYLRTFIPGTEVSRPVLERAAKTGTTPELPAPKKLEAPSK